MKKFFEDFKNFAMKGNVIDLAVGVIIGGAFGKIVTSLVNDIIMPLISVITGGINISDAAYPLVEAKGETEAVLLKYGSFIQNILDFLIIAFCIFMVIRLLSKFKRKEEVKAIDVVVAKPSAEVELLTEIRDLLSKKEDL